MLSPEFEQKLSQFPNLKKHFGGVFSADTIPSKIKLKSFLVCNTDVHKGPGKHWYCIVKINSTTLECFDSLGIDTEKKLFLESSFNHKNIRKIKFNVTQLQSSTSDTCGLFVLYFIVNRYHNQDLNFSDLVNEIFMKNIEYNETVVKQFALEHFQNE